MLVTTIEPRVERHPVVCDVRSLRRPPVVSSIWSAALVADQCGVSISAVPVSRRILEVVR